jgi:branched-subunit amino acid transport protein AzlD
MYNPIDGSTRSTPIELENQRRHQLDHAARQHAHLTRPHAPPSRAADIIIATAASLAVTLPWLAILAYVVAHGFQRHDFPTLPYGIPLLIGILVACIGVLITTRFKLSWMALSLAAATYAAFNL